MRVFNVKLFNINENNADKFFELISGCEGKVELISDGFRVDLRSRLVQYVSIAKIFLNKESTEVELLVYEQTDVDKFLEFMINGD